MKVSYLPSIFTILSLLFGYLALGLIIKGNFPRAIFFITGSVILDGFDGTVARLTKTESNFGVQLDSLVDAVTFGLVTAIMIYLWGFQETYPQMGKVVGFIFLSAGIIRLARFNVLKEADAVPSNIFVGLPIPLAALSICSFILMLGEPLKNTTDLILFAIFVVLIAIMMISNVKYRTMKKIRTKHSLPVLLLLAGTVALAINFPTYTLPALTFSYVISPLFFFLLDKIRKEKRQFPEDVDATPTPDRIDT
ncbi:MAG: CDP-diacylglycerol--serine O-phosphatidyltransferase [Candidatus Aminicenantes bacterium]|nr:CDP-diacylglycerol--serine O-phosphatidyltransferase [Candidatus Aminicenantes bacterium]